MRGSRAKKVSENGGRMPGGAKELGFLQRQRNRRHAVLADDKDLVDLVGEILEDEAALRHGCISSILS
jgi:hypothetical protein